MSECRLHPHDAWPKVLASLQIFCPAMSNPANLAIIGDRSRSLPKTWMTEDLDQVGFLIGNQNGNAVAIIDVQEYAKRSICLVAKVKKTPKSEIAGNMLSSSRLPSTIVPVIT